MLHVSNVVIAVFDSKPFNYNYTFGIACLVYKCTHGCMPFTAWLKIVYHDTTSEEESTMVEPYYTIESFLIPDLYLAINLEQPSQEGSDTYYPVHFFSKTEV